MGFPASPDASALAADGLPLEPHVSPAVLTHRVCQSALVDSHCLSKKMSSVSLGPPETLSPRLGGSSGPSAVALEDSHSNSKKVSPASLEGRDLPGQQGATAGTSAAARAGACVVASVTCEVDEASGSHGPHAPCTTSVLPDMDSAYAAHRSLEAFAEASFRLPYDCGVRAPWWMKLVHRGLVSQRYTARTAAGEPGEGQEYLGCYPAGLQHLHRSISSGLECGSQSRNCQLCFAVSDLVVTCGGFPRTQSATASVVGDLSSAGSEDVEEEAVVMIQEGGSLTWSVYPESKGSFSDPSSPTCPGSSPLERIEEE